MRRQLMELGASRLIFRALEAEAEEAVELLGQNDFTPNVTVRNGFVYEDAGWLISSSFSRKQSLVSGIVLGVDGGVYGTRKMIGTRHAEKAVSEEGRADILIKGGSQIISVAQPHRMRDIIKAVALPGRREERATMLGSDPTSLAVFYGSCRTLLDTYLDQRELKEDSTERRTAKLGTIASQFVRGQIDNVQHRAAQRAIA